MKKLSVILMCFAMILSLASPAHASEISNNSNSGTRAYEIPDTPHELGYLATITNLEAQHMTYTRYYFAPNNEKLRLSGGFRTTGDDTTTSRSVKIELYKIGDSRIVDSRTITGINSASTFTSFDISFTGLQQGNYYFIIRNTTSKSLSSSRSVNGEFTIG